jgi:hypothetical protein
MAPICQNQTKKKKRKEGKRKRWKLRTEKEFREKSLMIN